MCRIFRGSDYVKLASTYFSCEGVKFSIASAAASSPRNRAYIVKQTLPAIKEVVLGIRNFTRGAWGAIKVSL